MRGQDYFINSPRATKRLKVVPGGQQVIKAKEEFWVWEILVWAGERSSFEVRR